VPGARATKGRIRSVEGRATTASTETFRPLAQPIVRSVDEASPPAREDTQLDRRNPAHAAPFSWNETCIFREVEMSFSLVCTRPGTFQLVIRELDSPALGLLRLELAALMSSNATDIEVCVPDGSFVESSGSCLLESFFDIMWARGCRFTFARGQTPALPIGDGSLLRRLLTDRDRAAAIA
jgi:hypothetical protein